MTFLIDVTELKSGLVIFRRSDVKRNNWYCGSSMGCHSSAGHFTKKPEGSAGLRKFALAMWTNEPQDTMRKLNGCRFILDESLKEIGEYEGRYPAIPSALTESRTH